MDITSKKYRYLYVVMQVHINTKNTEHHLQVFKNYAVLFLPVFEDLF